MPGDLPIQQGSRKRSHKNVANICFWASPYFDPSERKAMFEEILPFFTNSDTSGAFIVIGALNMLLPTNPAPDEPGQLQPQDYLPTFFHLWSLVNRSKVFDTTFFDLFSRLARDSITSEHVPFSEYGIFTKDQSDLIFTALLRLTEIPVGQAHSPYGPTVDMGAGLGLLLERDKRKTPTGYSIARWLVMSLSPVCLDKPGSILSNMEGLLQSIDTFFHPSNNGAWTDLLAQIVFHAVDFFLLRWNREQSGEMETPKERQITPELKRRFVLSLRDVVYMGLFSKRSKIMDYYFSSIQGLATLEPSLILPGALQRFYPSLQGLVEVHRTTSSLCGLQMIANVMSKNRGFRCHLTALLALALPGIDANDLSKTQHTLNFIQAVAFSIPFVDLTKEHDEVHDSSLAIQWVQGEMERMEREGPNVVIDYDTELSDEDEANIVRSSTAGLSEFVLALLGKIFTLLENLPELSRARSRSPEDNVINILPGALGPLFANMSDELFDMVLEKVATFVRTHVVHQARDAMAFIISSICRGNPGKTLKVMVPMLIVGIRSEIDHNGAASDRSSGSDVLPRDRALVWHISMLSMVVVHVGDAVMPYKKELFDIAVYMQEKCRGIPTLHISNYIHHLLLNLTLIFPVDAKMYEPEVYKKGLDASDWGRYTKPSEMTINWHVPSEEELDFAVQLVESQVQTATERLSNLISDNPSVSRKGKNKEWSDEVSRNLSQVRLILAGVATLFDPTKVSAQQNGSQDHDSDVEMNEETPTEESDDPLTEGTEDEESRPQFHYRAGYVLERNSPNYVHIHKLREDVGHLLSDVHDFLEKHQEDDVACFTALYTAYRTWITDVGSEKSAHTLERLASIYKSENRPFKISGLRKQYPRPLLIKRAGKYHHERLKHNSSARPKSALDKKLLLNLASSSVSLYAEVRMNAQGALESALKSLIGGRPLVIPPLLDTFKKALETNDFDRIKGSLYTLLFTSLMKTILRDWRFAPDLVRLYIKAASVDKASIQKVGNSALYGSLLDAGKRMESFIVVDHHLVQLIEPKENCETKIKSRHAFIVERRTKVEEVKFKLTEEVVEICQTAHWRVVARCTIFMVNLGLRMTTLAPISLVELAAKGAITEHPGLRAAYHDALTRLLGFVETRAIYGHKFENYITENVTEWDEFDVTVNSDDPNWTKKYLNSFAEPGVPEYYVNKDWPGWLVWGKSFRVVSSRRTPFPGYDELELSVKKHIGDIITRDWLHTYNAYLKQEPRDASADRFRLQSCHLMIHICQMILRGETVLTMEEFKEEFEETYGDGSDKHQHRAASEILSSMFLSVFDWPIEKRKEIWDYCLPKIIKVFDEGLTPDNLGYWMAALHMMLGNRDPRFMRELYDYMASFRVDMTSNAAFKDSSQILFLEYVVSGAGWHFRNTDAALKDFLAHIDHPYKQVRDAMGRTIGTIYRTRYYEAFKNVDALLSENKASSSIGIKPYIPSEGFAATLKGIFDRLEVWRKERTPGQQTPSSYTSGCKTVLLWLDTTLQSHECTELIDFFPDVFMEQLLHMMDVKEDPELQALAYLVYRHLPNIPIRAGEDAAFIAALIRIGKSSTSWHQRLRTLINMQVIYFRRIFLIRPAEQQALFAAVADMLEDSALEVRLGASTTLAGMIRCSPVALRDNILLSLKAKFTEALKKNPMPKKTPGTSTPVSNNQQVIRRHAAVLGLGALITAFPYATPPPEWMPEVLALLASRAANDAGAVGKTVKALLADFKKTRQDTWVTDQKVSHFILWGLKDVC